MLCLMLHLSALNILYLQIHVTYTPHILYLPQVLQTEMVKSQHSLEANLAAFLTTLF